MHRYRYRSKPDNVAIRVKSRILFCHGGFGSQNGTLKGGIREGGCVLAGIVGGE